MSRLEFFQKDFKLDINFRYVSILLSKGSVPEWLKGADCKSAAGTLRWFESNSAQFKLSIKRLLSFEINL
jgi:hypothetical protein